MARRKDVNWGLPEEDILTEEAHLAVLMDIRDELKTLNRLLHCQNFVGIPQTLKRIDKRLSKKVPLR